MISKLKLVRYCAILFLLMTSGCLREQTNGGDNEILQTADPYAVGPINVNQDGIHLALVMKGDLLNGQLQLTMSVKNERSHAIVVDYDICSLGIEGEREAVPEPVGTYRKHLDEGEEEMYVVAYHPVNAVDFYERVGYRGDMKQHYSLSLNFIQDEHGAPIMDQSVTFDFTDESYKNYTDRAREKNIQIFDFDFDGDTFADRQTRYLKEVFRGDSSQHEVFAITPAITINRTVSNFRTFKEGDTLVIDLRMLNQSPQQLDVVMKSCEVKLSGKIFKPCHFSSDDIPDNAMDSVYAFKPGTRLHLLMKYHITETLDEWQLGVDWIFIHDRNHKKDNQKKKRFFHSSIPFKESSITKDSV